MKILLNTLYVVSPDRYLSLDGENVVISENHKEISRVPLHNLERILVFGASGVSPALMGKCAESLKELVLLSRNGKFLARVEGEVCGNVLLRAEQYRVAAAPGESLPIARNMIAAKIANARFALGRMIRDHVMRVDVESFTKHSENQRDAYRAALEAPDAQTLRGIEGEASALYFFRF